MKYFVVARAQAGVWFGKNDAVVLHQIPTAIGRADILIKTRFAPVDGFSKPVPMGLMAEVSGMATSINEALEEFAKAVQSLCSVLVFVGNSPIEDMTPELGYDISPGITEREYFQQFFPEERLLIVSRRRISSELVLRVLRVLDKHHDADRILRTMAQYRQALRNWEPGQEILALAHLWMGVETLTPVVLKRTLKSCGLDRSGLAAAWQVEGQQVDAEVRKRLLFHDDHEAYKKAKNASDGFEHGFLGFNEIHAHSDAMRARVASHLRSAILEELSLDAADVTTLTSSPYAKPGHLHITKYVRGTLVASADNLAADGQDYPFLQWSTSFQEVPNLSPDEVKYKMEEHFTGRFAEGVVFKSRKIEVRGGQELAIKRNNV